MKTLRVNHGGEGYDILISSGALDRAGELLSLDRRVLIVTDEGVPEACWKRVAAACPQATAVVLPAGEKSKTLQSAERLLRAMLEADFGRGDCVAAVGGGMIGDLAGFAAASYMRGIDFYNLPTTLLSQVDSSIGGKTGVNLDGVKNIVGAFYRPKKVIIDPEVLSTLPPRLRAEGMAEAVKMAVTSDAALLRDIETGDPWENVEDLLFRALSIKKTVVEQDETEKGQRRLLNFGHTLGHGIEAVSQGALYHGECVALGMLPMCSPALRERLTPLLERLGLPTRWEGDRQAVLRASSHDKKRGPGGIAAVLADEAGKGYIQTLSPEELDKRMKEVWGA